jgi:hypothetical protein
MPCVHACSDVLEVISVRCWPSGRNIVVVSLGELLCIGWAGLCLSVRGMLWPLGF